MMRFDRIIAGALLALSLAGCAGGGPTSQVSSQVSYLSPIMYETLDCSEVSEEAKTLSLKASRLTGISNAVASDDKTIYWPVALRVPAKGEGSAELGRLKYQFEALEKASQREKCKIQFKRNLNDSDTEQKSAFSSWITKIS